MIAGKYLIYKKGHGCSAHNEKLSYTYPSNINTPWYVCDDASSACSVYQTTYYTHYKKIITPHNECGDISSDESAG
jgi:hypothetical protein